VEVVESKEETPFMLYPEYLKIEEEKIRKREEEEKLKNAQKSIYSNKKVDSIDQHFYSQRKSLNNPNTNVGMILTNPKSVTNYISNSSKQYKAEHKDVNHNHGSLSPSPFYPLKKKNSDVINAFSPIKGGRK